MIMQPEGSTGNAPDIKSDNTDNKIYVKEQVKGHVDGKGLLVCGKCLLKHAFLKLNLEKKDIEDFQLTQLYEFVTQNFFQEHEHNGYEECKQLGTLLQNINEPMSTDEPDERGNSKKRKNAEDQTQNSVSHPIF
eukprot:GHVR01091622.1.p1 GENE.GHVR01091622.1~~GHVR01091622.1.p1  ORF type:complete len:134 (+),score=15.89 GHVR01091622.1:65-466(+)